MTNAHHLDEELVHRLPLPLAQLYRRSHNAKSALERHQGAYYLWEAALKLLGSVAIVEYAELGDHDPQLAERLQNLARPSLGHWWEFVRRLVPVLAATGDAHFTTTRELVLGRTRDDLPRAAGLDAALCEALENRGGARSTVRLSELFDRLVQYRNREMGHGAAGQHAGEFYERMGRALLAGIGELLGKLDVLMGRRLLYVAEVRGQASGNWLIERYELMGETARRIESVEMPAADAGRLPRAKGLYLSFAQGGSRALGQDPGIATGSLSLRLMRPLLVFDDDNNEMFFLNGRKGRRRAEYLCYTTGRVNDREELGTEQRDLLARVLGATVDDESVGTWAARSHDEEPPTPPGAAESPRRSLGEFELLSRIGRGGMGMVYRAWQPSLGRQVALKLLLRSGDPKAEARFAREIHSLGRVEHPNVVKIFTSGSEGDQWFYAMELVEGADLGTVCGHLTGSTASEVGPSEWHQALSTACREAKTKEEILSDAHGARAPAQPASAPEGSPISNVAPPSGAEAVARAGHGHVTQVVELIRQVAWAAHALHEARVIHRDIKPGNIMISPDGSHAILMDLGLAQLADETEGRLTRTRQFVGTLRYASPEQVLAAAPLDRRSDVYSLGATLWELLTLRPLFGATDATPTSDLMMQILQTDPERPQRLNPRVPADLQAIVMKCLDKDRKRRYVTAAEIAEDLARWQQGEPVRAQPPSLRYLLGKYVRRRRLPLAAAAAMVVALVAGLIALGTGVAVFHVSAARDDEKTARNDAEQKGKDLDAALQREVEARRREEAAHKRAEEFADLARERAVRLDIEKGVQLMDKGDLPGALVWFGDAMTMDKANSAQAEFHRMRLVAGMAECPRLARVWFHEGKILQAALSRDGRRLATAGSDGLVMVWKLDMDKEACRCKHASLTSLEFSPDGSRLVTTGEDKMARVWDSTTGELIAGPLVHRSTVHHAAFNPDGDRLVTTTEGKFARVWDAKTGRLLLTFQHTVERPASMGMDKTPPEGDAKKGAPADEIPSHEGAIFHAEFSPDGTLLVTASADKTARVWNAKNGQLVYELKLSGRVQLASFSPDGQWIATASHSPFEKYGKDVKSWSLQVWDAKTGDAVSDAFEHRDTINHFLFSSDSKWIVTASEDHTAQVWDLGAPRKPKRAESLPSSLSPFDPVDRLGAMARDDARRYPLNDRSGYHAKGVKHASFSPDGRYVISASSDGTARMWDALAGTPAGPPLHHGGRVIHGSFSSDGRWVLTVSEDQKVRLWDLQNPVVTDPTPKEARRVRSAIFSPNGLNMVLINEDGTVWLSKTNSGEKASLALKDGTGVAKAWFSPDGQRVATATDTGAIQVWKADTGLPITPPTDGAGEVIDAAFSNDARLLVVISSGPMNSGAMKLYDADSLAPAGELKQKNPVSRAVFSPNGKLLASVAAADQTLHFWDVKSGEEAFPLEQRKVFAVWDVAFSVDGHLLITADKNEKDMARVWNLTTGLPIFILKHHTFVTHVGFSRDGRQVITTDADNSAWVWQIAGEGEGAEPAAPSPITLEDPKAGPFQNIDFTAQATFSPNGRYVLTPLDDGAVQVWEVVTGEPLTPRLNHPGYLSYAAFSEDSKRVLTIGGGVARVWNLTPDPRLNPEGLLDLIQLQKGNQISSENGRFVPLDPVTFRQKWEKQRAADPESVAPLGEKDLSWHWRQAAECEAAAKWSAAIWHLDRVPQSQRTSLLWARRGDANRNLGDYAAALADYEEADKCDPKVKRLPWDIAFLARDLGDHCLDTLQARNKPFTADDAAPVQAHYQKCEESLDKLEKQHPGHSLNRAGYGDLLASYLRLGGAYIDASEGAAARNALERCQELLKKLPAGTAATRMQHHNLVSAYTQLAEMYVKNKEFDAARDAYRLCQDHLNSLPESDSKVVSSKRALATSFIELGDALSKTPNQKKEAREWYREALTLRLALDGGIEDAYAEEDLYSLYKKLGEISGELQDQAAEDYFLEAVKIARVWARIDPDSDTARRNVDITYDTLAEFRLDRGDLKGAEGYYRKSLEWDEKWLADQPESHTAVEMLRYTYKNLGTLRLRQGDKAGACENYQKAIQAAQDWIKANPANDDGKKDLADTYAHIGAACSKAGAPVDAIAYFREALKRRQHLVELSPDDTKAKTDLGNAEEWLGDLYLQVGDMANAIRHGRICVDLKRNVVEIEMQSADSRSSLGLGVWWLGIILAKAGETDKARDLFDQYVEIREKLHADDKKNADLEREVAYAYERVGTRYVAMGYVTQGMGLLQGALEIWEKASKDNSDDTTINQNQANLCRALATAAAEQGEVAAARENADKEREMIEALAKSAPDIVQWQTSLAANYGLRGNLELQAANFDAAANWHDKGLAILEKLDAAGKLTDKNSQQTLRHQRRNLAASKLAAEAMKDLDFAKKQESKERANDLLLLRAGIMARRGDFDDALATAEELRKLDPEDPKDLYNVARCYALLTRIVAKGRLKDQITNKDELSRHETCATRGIEALTQALEKGYEDSAHLLADADLDILRQEPGYVELVKHLKPNSVPKDE